MKFYIATGLAYILEHNDLRDLLTAKGHEITYDWTIHGSVKGGGQERYTEIARNEARGIYDADFVVVMLNPPTSYNIMRGTHVELGMAIACSTMPKIIIFANPSVWEQIEKNPCIFYHHENIHARVSGILEILDEVDKINNLLWMQYPVLFPLQAPIRIEITECGCGTIWDGKYGFVGESCKVCGKEYKLCDITYEARKETINSSESK